MIAEDEGAGERAGGGRDGQREGGVMGLDGERRGDGEGSLGGEGERLVRSGEEGGARVYIDARGQGAGDRDRGGGRGGVTQAEALRFAAARRPRAESEP